MKKLTVIATITIALTSNTVYATAGGKVTPPLNRYGAELMTAGGKVTPPSSNENIDTAGGKVTPPSSNDDLDTAGGKVTPPQSTDIVAQDSGTFSLSAIFSKYFSF